MESTYTPSLVYSGLSEVSVTQLNQTASKSSGRRCFNNKWINDYHWLEFDNTKNAAFCKSCWWLHGRNLILENNMEGAFTVYTFILLIFYTNKCECVFVCLCVTA